MASISLKYKNKQGTLTAPGDVDLGAMIPIATTTVGAGGSSTITFSSIPQNYEHLQIRGIARSTATTSTTGYSDSAFIRFNNDGSANYAAHHLDGNGSAYDVGADTSSTSAIIWDLGGAFTTQTANSFEVFVYDILDYSNTFKYKTLRVLGGADYNGYGRISIQSGLWQNTSAVNTITITNSVNFAQYSHFALYCIKRAEIGRAHV